MGLFTSLENAKKEEQAQIVPVKFTNVDLTVDQFNSKITVTENLISGVIVDAFKGVI